MRLIWFFAALVVCATAASLNKQPSVNDNGKIRYDGYKVYKLNIKNKEQLSVIGSVEDLREKVNKWKFSILDINSRNIYCEIVLNEML